MFIVYYIWLHRNVVAIEWVMRLYSVITSLTRFMGGFMNATHQHHQHQWALQDAKAQLSELVKKAEYEGPQFISVHGNPAVVVISQDEYLSLIAPQTSLVDFFQQSPLAGLSLNIKRDKSFNREIDL